jgi:hypothetical protein
MDYVHGQVSHDMLTRAEKLSGVSGGMSNKLTAFTHCACADRASNTEACTLWCCCIHRYSHWHRKVRLWGRVYVILFS